ncbi:helix-turn-helix domain-containing protein [Mesorhizobium xinjiangense]|uniref:helix-turn-helix domain-containing protein n=1 Tax=Mesorhizobium xinjiangense TaxID=2678685 RepID=UPI0012EDC954|nr:helix-turn-helix transcriptional regulator [Mesorhizobium xinjiangense]
MTSLKELKKKWMKDAEFKTEYDAMEEEFAVAAALFDARAKAHMTQEEVARAMGTTQAVIARLEGGGSLPSTRTLKKFAQATGMRLRISFEPDTPHSAPPS